MGANGPPMAPLADSTGFQARLRLYLLGPPQVEYAGQPLAVPRRQTRALLYYLAAHPQAAPRERLCFLFWPDTPESQARRHLSHLLTHLRRAMPDPSVLWASVERVGLDPAQVWLDVAVFEKLCAASPPACRRAAALYRGPFLAGFSLPASPEFEIWSLQEQRRCEQLYLDALAALLEELATGGEHEEALACARRYLATDDLAEDVHRRLIELYALTGKRSAALHQFERCTLVLERELGVSPLPETRAVYQAVLDGRLPVLVRPLRPTWATLREPDTPLLGRDEALRRLQGAYDLASAAQGQFLLITGEAGIGKSRLMQEFATRLQDRALILTGAAQPGEQTLPYHAVAQALHQALEHPALQRAPVAWLAEAARLLPELRAWRPDLPVPLAAKPEEARARLLEALCRLVLELAAGPQPLLLCLDDLQWADKATLDWLIQLAPRLPASRLLLLAAYRREQAAAVQPLRRNLRRLGLLAELKLRGLAIPTVLQLVRHLLGRRSGDGVWAKELRRVTGGNPFYLLETLRALLETGQAPDDLATVAELPLPDTVRQAVQARLSRLSPQARQVLETGALLRAPFGFDLVHQTAGRGEMETMDALDELVTRYLLVEQPAGYRFRHDLIRQATEAGLSPVRHQLLHRRAGRVLERLAPDALVELAHHFDAGGQPEKALNYRTLAARQAEAVFAWREAERHQSRILELLERLDPACSQPESLSRRGQVLASRAHQRFLQGRLAERDADLEALAALAEAADDDDLRRQALLHRTRYLNLEGRYQAAIATAEEGLALEAGDATTGCQLLVEIGFAHYFLGRPRPGLAALESALSQAGEEAEPSIRGPILHNLGYIHLHLGDHAQALVYQQEAYACHQEAGNYNRLAWASLDIGFLHLKLGRWVEAERHLTASLELARRIGARSPQAYALTYLGYWELYRGRYAAAADLVRQALPLQQAMHTEHGVVAAEIGLGLARHHLGRADQARRWLLSAVERARSVGHRRRLVEALVGLGLVEITAGRLPAAQRYLVDAVAVARESECREMLATGLAALSRTERRLGNFAGALEHAREAARIAQEGSLPACEAWAEMEAGLTLLAQGEPAAVQHTARAVSLLPQTHEGWLGSEEIHRAHAQALQALGRAKEAGEHVRQAQTLIEGKASYIAAPQQRRSYLQHTASTPL